MKDYEKGYRDGRRQGMDTGALVAFVLVNLTWLLVLTYLPRDLGLFTIQQGAPVYQVECPACLVLNEMLGDDGVEQVIRSSYKIQAIKGEGGLRHLELEAEPDPALVEAGLI